MTIYDSISFLAPFLEAFTYFLLFEAFLEREKKRSSWHYLAGIIALACFIGICNQFFIYSFINIVLIASVCFLICSFLYEGPSSKKLMAVILVILISGICEVCAAHLLTLLFGINIHIALETSSYRAMGIMIAKILGIIICNVIRVKCISRHTKIGRAYWIMFFLLFASTIFLMFFVSKLTFELGNPSYAGMAIISTFGLFFIAFFSIYLYERLARQSESIRAQERYEEHMRLQMKHLSDLAVSKQELLGFKHDINNQLVIIQGYFKNQDIQGGSAYVSRLLKNQEAENLIIDTGNLALDILLSTKKVIAEHKGITFDFQVQIPENMFIQPVDQCVIFGNAIDNAIEACEKCPEDDRNIEFILLQRKNRIICKITNSLPVNYSVNLSTTKEDKKNHGYGLINLTQSLERYDSIPIFEQDNQKFILSFIVYEK